MIEKTICLLYGEVNHLSLFFLKNRKNLLTNWAIYVNIYIRRKEVIDMTKWYGSLDNRLEEGHVFCDEIKVGTGVTEYYWSDRVPYEVVEVIDQKHVIVRELDHKHVGDGVMDNNWELVSNEENSLRKLELRGKTWYWTSTIYAEDIEGIDDDTKIRLIVSGFDPEKIRAKGKQTKREKANVSFGVASYYYDYSF